MTRKPNLQHQELEALYQYDFSIPRELLTQILQLPKVSLVEDLEAILEDAIQNYKHYEVVFEGEENQFLAPAHAIFILGELKAIDSLPKLEYFFSQNEEFIDFWMGDLLTEELWVPFYKLAESDILRLFPFIKKLGVDAFSKAPFAEAAFLYLVFHPEQKTTLLPNYKSLLNWLINKAKEYPDWDNHNENLSNIVWDIIRNQAVEFKEEVELAVKADLIDELDAEQWEREKTIFYREEECLDIKMITIFEQYKELEENYNFTDHEESAGFFTSFLQNKGEGIEEDFEFRPISKAEKTAAEFTSDIIQKGECPCGSGRKYIACCLKNLN